MEEQAGNHHQAGLRAERGQGRCQGGHFRGHQACAGEADRDPHGHRDGSGDKGSQVRGQMEFVPDPDSPPTFMVDGKPVDPETGEIKGDGNVVDFRAARQA